MHINRSGLNVRRGVPHGLEQMRARLNASAPLGEENQQLVLGGREIDRVARDGYRVRGSIDGYFTDFEQVVLLRLRSRSAQNRLDPEHELRRAERLRQIIVGTQRQSANSIGLITSRGEHQHGDGTGFIVAAYSFEYVEAGQAR